MFILKKKIKYKNKPYKVVIHKYENTFSEDLSYFYYIKIYKPYHIFPVAKITLDDKNLTYKELIIATLKEYESLLQVEQEEDTLLKEIEEWDGIIQ